MNKVEEFAKKNGWNYGTYESFPGVKSLSDVIVIILPTWSQKDFKIITKIKGQISKLELPIYLFDIDQFVNLEIDNPIEDLFPDIPFLRATPVILYYRNGFLCGFLHNDLGLTLIS
ncbi:MAG: hypothetical protein G3M70_06900 [Candidatus Nitronauta litoralis]|uniref:Uncharacterized protein n=1 Tax=Candidatus Nitronauta litoralis TaxID=2705533 RepID=A0A7T0BVH5_9BACT|nr:MAG: hypothetical protein G3M70_06900 [Candidatus Nitronauta litoralis]